MWKEFAWKDKNFVLLLTSSLVIIGILIVATNSNKVLSNRLKLEPTNVASTLQNPGKKETVVTSATLPKDSRKVSLVVQKSGVEVGSTMTQTKSEDIVESGNSASQDLGGVEEQTVGVTSLSISLDPENSSTLSAMSLRLIYNMSNPNLSPGDLTLKVNQDLLSSNWTAPVKSVFVADNGQIYIDLALVNINAKGYLLNDFTQIVEIDTGGKSVKLSDFSFDNNETKVITKEGKELNLNFILQ